MYVPALPLRSALGAIYDRRPPSNATEYPKCATQAQHDAAHAACKPQVLRGLGLLDFKTANQCWVEMLPICPPPALPRVVILEPPRKAPAPAPVPVRQTTPILEPPRRAPAPAPVVAVAPPIVAPPPFVAPPPPPIMAPPLPPEEFPEAPPPPVPAQAGFSTGGLLALAAGIAVGGWLLFGRKKKQPA